MTYDSLKKWEIFVDGHSMTRELQNISYRSNMVWCKDGSQLLKLIGYILCVLTIKIFASKRRDRKNTCHSYLSSGRSNRTESSVVGKANSYVFRYQWAFKLTFWGQQISCKPKLQPIYSINPVNLQVSQASIQFYSRQRQD